MHIIVDGYNLIRQSETLRRFERSGLEAGRKELIRRLSLYRKNREHKITVVFDGWISGSSVEERDREGGVVIIYSKRGERADDVIRRMVAKHGEETVVVTSDRGLADSISKRGTTAVPSPVFESRLFDDSRTSFRFDEEKGDDQDNQMTPGTKKKGPSRKISRKTKKALTRIKKL